MCSLNHGFAFSIAILAIGFAIASKANMLGSRIVTACFTAPELTNGAAIPVLFAPAPDQTCAAVRSTITTRNTLWLNQFVSLNSESNCVSAKLFYCCIIFDMDSTAPANVPLLNIGGLDGKFKVIEVRCHD